MNQWSDIFLCDEVLWCTVQRFVIMMFCKLWWQWNEEMFLVTWWWPTSYDNILCVVQVLELCDDVLRSVTMLFTNEKSFVLAHSFGQFKKHALLKAHTQSSCFSHPGLARAFISSGSADLSSFSGVSGGWAQDLLCSLPVYDRAKMRPVYLLIVSLTDFLLLCYIK